jgi:hypothetical protein
MIGMNLIITESMSIPFPCKAAIFWKALRQRYSHSTWSASIHVGFGPAFYCQAIDNLIPRRDKYISSSEEYY